MHQVKVTFENYFGEDLLQVMLFRKMATTTIYNIKDKETRVDVATFDAWEWEDENWQLQLVTASGEYWKSAGLIECAATKEDDYKIIIGVNGESKRIYAAFSNSSSCSAPLKKL